MGRLRRSGLIIACLAGCYGAEVFASGGDDPVIPILLGLAIILAGAKVGAIVASRLGQPAVLGELLMGVLFGNLAFLGIGDLSFISEDPTFAAMAGLGVILLLFEVGLETSIGDLVKVGASSFVVAIVGVIAPFGLGWATSAWLMPDAIVYVHVFVGATLCATSVGITARVLKDLGKIQSKESRIILGAAVIDDVLGLIILAVVSGIIVGVSGGEKMTVGAAVLVAAKAVGFLLLAIVLGLRMAPLVFQYGARLKSEGVMLLLALLTCFVMSYLASLVGLAPIVGAFAGGLIIDGAGFAKFYDLEEHSIEDLLLPVSKFFVPIFFVMMGMDVDLETFQDPKVIGIALALTLVAIIGKQVCGLGVLEKGLNRVSIGVGMVPRGEVGLIFAVIGSQLMINGRPVVDPPLYSAIVIMCMVTTMITPPGLKWALSRKS